jgi:hypothetical protein
VYKGDEPDVLQLILEDELEEDATYSRDEALSTYSCNDVWHEMLFDAKGG